jgi:hypothetical protein
LTNFLTEDIQSIQLLTQKVHSIEMVYTLSIEFGEVEHGIIIILIQEYNEIPKPPEKLPQARQQGPILLNAIQFQKVDLSLGPNKLINQGKILLGWILYPLNIPHNIPIEFILDHGIGEAHLIHDLLFELELQTVEGLAERQVLVDEGVGVGGGGLAFGDFAVEVLQFGEKELFGFGELLELAGGGGERGLWLGFAGVGGAALRVFGVGLGLL